MSPWGGPPYLGVHTRLPSLVLFVGATLVQFVPQGFGLPGGHLRFELGVEVSVVQRVQVQVLGEDVEGLQGPFACGSLDKVLKNLPGLALLLVLILPHGSGATWSSGVDRTEGITMKHPEKRHTCKGG